jgi:hypothetical protein
MSSESHGRLTLVRRGEITISVTTIETYWNMKSKKANYDFLLRTLHFILQMIRSPKKIRASFGLLGSSTAAGGYKVKNMPQHICTSQPTSR